MALPSRPHHAAAGGWRGEKKTQRRGIILLRILSPRCPQPVPRNYSKCDCAAGFGISEMQTPLPLPPAPPTHTPSLSLFRLQHFHHMQNGGASQKVFQGLGSFQPFDNHGCANAELVTLATARIPAALLKTAGERVGERRKEEGCCFPIPRSRLAVRAPALFGERLWDSTRCEDNNIPEDSIVLGINWRGEKNYGF